MTNDLKNFLEEEYRKFGTDYGDKEKWWRTGFYPCMEFCCGGDFCEGHEKDIELIKQHNTRLINFVLDLVEKEVEKATIYYYNDKAHFSEDDISTIINKLRV